MELKKQHGMTVVSGLAVLILLGFFVLVMVRLVPVYIEDYNVRGVLKSLSSDADELSQNHSPDTMVSAVKTSLAKRFAVNNITSISANDVEVTPTKQGVEMRLEYESRVHLLANIDVVIHFEHTEVVQTP